MWTTLAVTYLVLLLLVGPLVLALCHAAGESDRMRQDVTDRENK